MNTIKTTLVPAMRRHGKYLAIAAALCIAPLAHAAVSAPVASSDASSVSYQMAYTGTPQYARLYLDTDRKTISGYASGGVGADYLVENGSLYRYSGSGGSNWGWTLVKAVTYSMSGGTVKWTIARSDLGSPAAVDLVGETEAPVSTSSKVTQAWSTVPITPITPAAPAASSDANNSGYLISFSGTPSYVRVFLDTDKSATTGYSTGGIGANYMLENGGLYRYAGTGGSNWAWTYVKAITYTQMTGSAKFVVARADIGSPSALNFIAESESPAVTSAVMSQALTTTTTPPPDTTPPPATTPTNTVSYNASSALIANPERGFYNAGGHCESGTFNQSVLQGYRVNDANTLVICVFYLSNFKTSAISASTLSYFQKQMDTVRAAGLKALVRFAYTENMAGDDASLTQVKAHMDQLAPYFAANSDVMFVMQEGWVGAWGEGAFSINFGMGGSLTAKNIADRKAVIDKMLQVVPANRMIQIRTPLMKTSAYGTTALQASEAFSGAAKARTGHHNDCFLHGSTDSGTYNNTATDYPYLAAETTYLPMGGETCGLSAPRTDCPTATGEMAKFHWSYLNLNYNVDVINGWRNQGCFNQIKQSLGYRFVLQNGTYSTSGKPGGSISVAFNLKNAGWAAPFNARGVDLILRNTATGAIVRLPISTDPRLWLGGNTIAVKQTLTLPSNMASGKYAAFLSMPDAAPSLAARPEYAIQFANTGTWEASTGLNNLNHTMSVAP